MLAPPFGTYTLHPPRFLLGDTGKLTEDFIEPMLFDYMLSSCYCEESHIYMYIYTYIYTYTYIHIYTYIYMYFLNISFLESF